MKRMVETVAYRVVSEPGDCTRYDYLVFRKGWDFYFVGIESKFPFTAVMNCWEIEHADKQDIVSIAERYDCNACTVMECMRTIKEIMKKEGDYELEL
jgi:hypothetical protein